MTASAIYRGTVGHRRKTPVEHSFEHQVGMLYLDLDELPSVLDDKGPFWSASRAAPGRFRRADYHGDPATPLKQSVLDTVERELGHRPAGPVRVLTTPRTFGRAFNPVSFYYCFAPGGETVEAVVADVTNTPWGESHPYVMDARDAGRVMRSEHDKVFHVSPFQGMSQRYSWALTPPDQTLSVHITADEPGASSFDATLNLEREPLTRRNLNRLLARFPGAALRTLTLIYGHALRLKFKGAPYYAHPDKTRTT